MKKFLIPILAIFILASSQSCLKNQVDYFGETAASRMEKYLKNAREVLYGSEQGWRMEYFTDYGGYNYAVRFIDEDKLGNQIDSVLATSELSNGVIVGSNFRLTNDNGPVLSFDTYNEILHYFATASSSDYQANGGDFEFIILSAKPSEVVLKGKRTGRITKMYPLDEDIVAFAQRMTKAAENFVVVSAEGVNYDGEKIHLDFDLNTHSVIFSGYKEGSNKELDELNAVTVAYIVTEDGIKLSESFTFKGIKFDELSYNKSGRMLFNDDVSFRIAALPADYTSFRDFLGDFTFTYSNGQMSFTKDVTISVYNEMSKIVEITGFTEDYHGIYLSYNATSGRLQMFPQYAGVWEERDYIVLIPILSNNYYSFSGYLDLVPNPTPEAGFKFVNCPDNKTSVVAFGMLREFLDDEGETDYDQFDDWSPNLIYPKTLVRK